VILSAEFNLFTASSCSLASPMDLNKVTPPIADIAVPSTATPLTADLIPALNPSENFLPPFLPAVPSLSYAFLATVLMFPFS